MKDHWLAFDVRQLILDGQFSAVCEFCNDNPAPLVAEILSVLTPQDVWQILAKLSISEKVDIFSYFEPDTQVSLAKIIPRKDFAEILTEMSADDRVDLLKDMTREMREAILPAIAQAEREEVRPRSSHLHRLLLYLILLSYMPCSGCLIVESVPSVCPSENL